MQGARPSLLPVLSCLGSADITIKSFAMTSKYGAQPRFELEFGEPPRDCARGANYSWCLCNECVCETPQGVGAAARDTSRSLAFTIGNGAGSARQ